MAKTEGGKGSPVYWDDTHGHARWAKAVPGLPGDIEVIAKCPTCGDRITFTQAYPEDIVSFCEWFGQDNVFGYGPNDEYEDAQVGDLETGDCMKKGCGWVAFTDDSGPISNRLPTLWGRRNPVTVEDDPGEENKK